jgi:hypothetical protein
LTEPAADRLCRLLRSDVCTEKRKLRSDNLLVRERMRLGLGDATARPGCASWPPRGAPTGVPPSTREQRFPPAEVMEPIRRAAARGGGRPEPVCRNHLTHVPGVTHAWSFGKIMGFLLSKLAWPCQTRP